MRLLNLIDEHTRECLMIQSERTWYSTKVIETLADVMVTKGVPKHLRSDNILTPEGKAGEKKRSLSIPYGIVLTVTPSGFYEQGAEHSTVAIRDPACAVPTVLETRSHQVEGRNIIYEVLKGPTETALQLGAATSSK